MTDEQNNTNPNDPQNRQQGRENQYVEEIEVQGNQLVEKVQGIIKEGNVRRLIIRTQDDRVLLDTPLTVGLGVGGVLAWLGGIPLIAVTAIAAAFTRLKVEVVREVTGDNDVVQGHKQEVKIDVDDE